MPTWSTGSRPRRGFTLVELIVVLVIVATLATMVIPRFAGSAQSAQLRENADQLLVMARYAQNYAVTHRSACRIVIDPQERRFGLEIQEDPLRRPDEFTVVKDGPAKPQTLGEGIGFGSLRVEHGPRGRDIGPSTIAFTPTGESDSAVVEITNGRRTLSLVLIPSSGRATLVEGTVSRPANDRRDLDA